MTAPDHDSPEHFWARSSARLGIIAMGLCIAGPCTCYTSYFLALPCSLIGLWLGRLAFAEAPAESATRAYSKVGMITSGTAAVFSIALCGMITMWTMAWMLLIFLDSM